MGLLEGMLSKLLGQKEGQQQLDLGTTSIIRAGVGTGKDAHSSDTSPAGAANELTHPGTGGGATADGAHDHGVRHSGAGNPGPGAPVLIALVHAAGGGNGTVSSDSGSGSGGIHEGAVPWHDAPPGGHPPGGHPPASVAGRGEAGAATGSSPRTEAHLPETGC